MLLIEGLFSNSLPAPIQNITKNFQGHLMANQKLNIAGKYQRFEFIMILVSSVYCYGAKHREITKKIFPLFSH